MVLKYHPGISSIATFHRLTELGACGVDIFFCISGFVITHSARRLPAGAAPAIDFARRRLLRVLPPYWIFTAALLGTWLIGIGFRDLVMTPGLIVASLLLIPFPKRTVTGDLSYHPLLDVGWTLTFEMYFYTICTAIVAAAGGRRLWPWAAPALLAMAGFSLLAGGSGSVPSSVFASPLLLEFLFGVATARFAAGREAPGIGICLIVAGTIGLAASIYLPDPMAWRLLCWGIPGAAIVLGCVLVRVAIRRPVARAAVFLGTASYSIYLAHPIPLLVAASLTKKGLLTRIDPDLLIVALTVSTIGVTALSYFAVEGPLIHLLRPRSKTVAMADAVTRV